MPSFIFIQNIGLLVLAKTILKVNPWRPSWSCDLDHLYKLSFPLPKDAPHEVWLSLAKLFQRRYLKVLTDGRAPEHDHPLSSTFDPSAQVS